jgi:hypothetical protein
MIPRADTSAMWHKFCDVDAMGGDPLTATHLVAFPARGAPRLVSGCSQGLLT